MAKRIAFFGPAGTYTEEAALRHDASAELQAFSTIAAVGQAVSSGITDEGVVPIENSLEGSVTYTLDLLISQPGLSICKEIVLPIDHYLMAKPGTRLDNVQVVYSHPQALAQCRNYLERRLPKAHQMASLSTVEAVVDMKASKVPAAAIAPRRAADLHGVDIIAQSLQDSPNNVTRFVVLARADHPPTGKDKTSICFSFDQDAPSLLYHALGEFAQWGINLAKVESRPTKELLGRYIFLIDCDGHRTDPPVAAALAGLARQASMLKVLGSYPRWNS
ncbi:MAG: prephenate dehydratase [Dehalococcoidia bacterium]|nr:prephenate dehydratase [Dehalococcoidia bacterium]MSQ16067.1 prephenate dehydratase [Dehalococcoidia bacterium]